jgi:hypothetical protein
VSLLRLVIQQNYVKHHWLTCDIQLKVIHSVLHYFTTKSRISFTVMLSVVMLTVIMLSVVMLSVVMLSVVMLTVVILRVMLTVIILSVIMLCVVVPVMAR